MSEIRHGFVFSSRPIRSAQDPLVRLHASACTPSQPPPHRRHRTTHSVDDGIQRNHVGAPSTARRRGASPHAPQAPRSLGPSLSAHRIHTLLPFEVPHAAETTRQQAERPGQLTWRPPTRLPARPDSDVVRFLHAKYGRRICLSTRRTSRRGVRPPASKLYPIRATETGVSPSVRYVATADDDKHGTLIELKHSTSAELNSFPTFKKLKFVRRPLPRLPAPFHHTTPPAPPPRPLPLHSTSFTAYPTSAQLLFASPPLPCLSTRFPIIPLPSTLPRWLPRHPPVRTTCSLPRPLPHLPATFSASPPWMSRANPPRSRSHLVTNVGYPSSLCKQTSSKTCFTSAYHAVSSRTHQPG